MACLRRYDWQPPIIYMSYFRFSTDKFPCLSINVDTLSGTVSISRDGRVYNLVVLDELRRIYELLDNPNWKYSVKCIANLSDELPFSDRDS